VSGGEVVCEVVLVAGRAGDEFDVEVSLLLAFGE
jgi:hypothetical protein